jgi:sugar phosphate isomerase/epimerase
LFEFLDLCARMNLDGVELTSYYFPEPLTSAFLNKVTRHAFLLGLEVGGSATRSNFCLPMGSERNAQLDHVRQWLDYSADMGSRAIRIFAGDAPKGVSDEQARKWVVECIEELLPHAEKCGVILAMENHGGVVSDADGTLAITDALRSDWFGLKWDCGNYRTADPYADLQRTVAYAVTTHVKVDIYPGGKKAVTDLPRVVKMLKDAGYRGYVHLEYEATEEPKTAIPRILAELQKLAVRSSE